MEEDNAKLLQTYKRDLETYRTDLEQKVQECKKALQRGSHFNVGYDIHYPVNIPLQPTLGMATFTPNRTPGECLKKALGEVTISAQSQGRVPHGNDRLVGSSGERLSTTSQQPSQKFQTPPVQQRSKKRKEEFGPIYTLLTKTKQFREWTSRCQISSACPNMDDQLWTCDNYRDSLTLFDREGNTIQEVKHDTRIWDISLSPITNTLWACDWEHNISELVSGRLEHRFSTYEKPECICITASNHVIVGMAGQISKFTTKGELLPTTSATAAGEPLVSLPYRVSECRLTHNLAMIVLNDESVCCDGNQHMLVVMDTHFKELFVYDGEVPDTYQPTSQSGDKPFEPRDVVLTMQVTLS
ncbi:uncharacterized protein LOC117332524 [Pecten maximus]|uniref:uncharacterized protein LOC117332524 n=1 Tax=Pecten maximus TaxID=6579 RepID=UPI0014580500|nr:uncharacterized protein LOC117332524 [Pecten maximus]